MYQALEFLSHFHIYSHILGNLDFLLNYSSPYLINKRHQKETQESILKNKTPTHNNFDIKIDVAQLQKKLPRIDTVKIKSGRITFFLQKYITCSINIDNVTAFIIQNKLSLNIFLNMSIRCLVLFNCTSLSHFQYPINNSHNLIIVAL